MQPFDYTTLIAVCTDLQQSQLPARLETVYQRDRYTVSLGLRTLSERVWLNLVWHPQAARLHLDDPPPREPDTFTFSQQLASLLKGLALTAIEPVQPWERVLDLQFSYRPGEATQWHLYVEIMGKYSNVLLVNAEAQIVTAAHQVSDRQSRVRPIQTGQPYVTPPSLQGAIPNLNESFVTWNERVSLIPGAIAKMLVQTYRGVSSQLARTLVSAADCNPQTPTTDITPSEWQAIYAQWQAWLNTLATGSFQPGWAASGYTVLGGDCVEPVANIHQLLAAYYGQQLQQQHFQQLHNQLSQKLKQQLSKLRAKATGFTERLQQSDDADQQRSQADLLMANLHAWQPGLTELLLPDFETGQPVKIALNPERTAIQNAQALYKQHQKRKRARRSVEPLLTAVQQDIDYLEHVEASLVELHHDQGPESLAVLQEVATELSQQGYLPAPERRSARSNATPKTSFHHYQTPSGFEVLVGRNNQQNDHLTFRLATEYDLWFHAQEIPGSHVLLRLQAGKQPSDTDLQFVANVAAHHSRGRQSQQVPVVYTQPRHVYKPKGTPPGLVIYKHETILWGQPQTLTT